MPAPRGKSTKAIARLECRWSVVVRVLVVHEVVRAKRLCGGAARGARVHTLFFVLREREREKAREEAPV